MNDAATDIVPVEAEVLALTVGDPADIVARAKEMADTLRQVIQSRHLYATIRGKEFVMAEGWTTLGAMVGVFPQIEWTRPMEDATGKTGWEARCLASTQSGQVIGAAEAQCTRSEKTWAGRDDYALRSMAQTRAVGKAMRVPLSWVMTMTGYEVTPAEEMPRDEPPASDGRPQSYDEHRESATQPKEEPIAALRDRTGALIKGRVEKPEMRAYLEKHAPQCAEEGKTAFGRLTREQCDEIIADLEPQESAAQ